VLPAAGDLRMSVAGAGLKILRNNVRVSRLSFRGFAHEADAAAIVLGNASGPNAITNVVLDSITVDNCYVGVMINYIAGVGVVQVVNSTICNTIAGIYQTAGTMTVTNCFIGTVSQQDPFAFRAPLTAAAVQGGIVAYSQTTNGLIRGNIVTGHSQAIHVKTVEGGYFRIEHNTLIGDYAVLAAGQASLGVSFVRYGDYGRTNAVIKNNLIDGFGDAYGYDESPTFNATVDRNLLWCIGTYGPQQQKQADFATAHGLGTSNLVADPLLAGRYTGDYRPLPGSPARYLADDGLPVGALPLLTTNDLATPPSLRIDIPYISGVQFGPSTAAVWNGRDLLASTYNLRGTTFTVNVFPYSVAPVTTTTVTVSTAGQSDVTVVHPFVAVEHVTLPAAGGYVVRLTVQNAAGGSSDGTWVTVNRLPAKAPIPVSIVRANTQGFLVVAQNNEAASQYLQYRLQGQTTWQRGASSAVTYGTDFPDLRSAGLQPLVVTGLTPNAVYQYQVVATADDNTLYSAIGTVTTTGPALTTYISPSGADGLGRGTANAPLKTLQYALDLALPGDDLRLLPGTYYGGFILAHGGTSVAPITLEADQPGTVALNGNMENNCVLLLMNLTDVKIRGLAIQWAKTYGLCLNGCARVEASGNCFFDWYLPAYGCPSAYGLVLANSPGCSIHNNVLYKWWIDTAIQSSPNTSFYQNTAVAAAEAGLRVGFGSAAGSYIAMNSLNGSHDHGLDLCATPGELAQLSLDYNNYGTVFQSPGLADANTIITINGYPWFGGSRELAVWEPNPSTGVVKTYYSFAQWKADTGKDSHSIFADPAWVSPLQGDFRLLPGSPNLNLLDNGSGDHPGLAHRAAGYQLRRYYVP
jgi:hypothetical protein